MPASVAAPLPSVAAALEQLQQAGEEQAAAVAAQQALVLAPVQVRDVCLRVLLLGQHGWSSGRRSCRG